MNGIATDEYSAWRLSEADAFSAAFPSTLSPVLFQGFVLAVTVIREAAEEIRCYMRDKEVNSQIYSKLTGRGECWVGCVGLCWELHGPGTAWLPAGAALGLTVQPAAASMELPCG